MDTTFDVLRHTHADLIGAARRERLDRESRRPRRPRQKLVAAVVALLAAAGAVGWLSQSGGSILRSISTNDSGNGSAPASAGGGAARTPFAPVAAPSTVPGVKFDSAHAATGASGGTGPGGPTDISRIIRAADLTVTIPRGSFEQRFGEAGDIAERHGGFVEDSRTQTRSGSLTLRVPAANFDATLRALRQLGTVNVQAIHGQDVTLQYVDLQARLRITRARREVLLKLMQKATSIEQTIRVQNALDETQLRIEQIQGQLNVLNDQTSLATIKVALREEGVEPPAKVENPSIVTAFKRGVSGFVAVVGAIVTGLGYLLPILAIALVWWLVAARLRGRRATR